MHHAGWMDVLRLTLSVAAEEPVWIRIALVLGAALVFVMCLEGLYASLCPLRYAARIARNHGDASPALQKAPPEQAKVYAAAPVPAPVVPRVPRPFAVKPTARLRFRRGDGTFPPP